MYWLRDTVSQKGATLVTGCVSGNLLAQEDALLKQYNAIAIINATGLSAFELAGDKTVYPLRGALIRVVNDGKRFPKVTEALAVGIDEAHKGEQELVFIVPRNDEILILGGTRHAPLIELSLHHHSDMCLQGSRNRVSGTLTSASRALRLCACGSAATTSCLYSRMQSTTPMCRLCRATAPRDRRTCVLSGRCARRGTDQRARSYTRTARVDRAFRCHLAARVRSSHCCRNLISGRRLRRCLRGYAYQPMRVSGRTCSLFYLFNLLGVNIDGLFPP